MTKVKSAHCLKVKVLVNVYVFAYTSGGLAEEQAPFRALYFNPHVCSIFVSQNAALAVMNSAARTGQDFSP